jgi:acetate kinase
MLVLVLNPGSATLKATVLDPPDAEPRYERLVEWAADASDAERQGAVDHVARSMVDAGIPTGAVAAVGYRVVHGGALFTGPVLVDDATVAAIDELADLAPLHDPVAASTMRAARRAFPAAPHVAVFDTAFHAGLPPSGYRYPVPDAWWLEHGVRRYGFHGLSVEWSARRAAAMLDRPADGLRLVVAHLGGGCSVTAVDGGHSVDTSMGMTPLEGLMMGTRAGSIDPGIVFRLLRDGIPADDIERDLERASGLRGVAGTDDMRVLLADERSGDERAGLAIELFVRRAAAAMAAAATALPSLDALVFTGGIGEHAGSIRRRICERLAVLGAPVPDGADAGEDDAVLAVGPGGIAVLRVHAREDIVIAEETARLARESRLARD